MKSNNKKPNPCFGVDKDGNVYVAHDTSFDRSNKKKEKNKIEIKGKEFDSKSIVDVGSKSDEEEGNANKMIKKWRKMNKKNKINLNLFGLIVISVAAFIGFGAIFSQMELNLGAQASSAAFAALFILLSTKFLMEKESENNLKNEKANKVFAANLKDYKNASQKMLKIMENNTITEKEIHELLHSLADLIIFGSHNSRFAFQKFITKSQVIFEDALTTGGINQRDDDIILKKEDSITLWKYIVDFQIASREGLDLDIKRLDKDSLNNTFGKLISKQDNIDNKFAASEYEWLSRKGSTKRLSKNEFKKIEKELENLIRKINEAGLKEKIAKSQITFRNPKFKNKVIMFINDYTKKTGTFRCDITGTPSREFLERYEKELTKASILTNASIKPHGKNNNYMLFNLNAGDETQIKIITDMLKAYMEEFHK